MPDAKSKVHDVVIQIHTNRPITAEQAQYAAWNAVQHQPLYGGDDRKEPWTIGHITVRKRLPTKETCNE
jgi:hypothetical protein